VKRERKEVAFFGSTLPFEVIDVAGPRPLMTPHQGIEFMSGFEGTASVHCNMTSADSVAIDQSGHEPASHVAKRSRF
jgi:hypothetical protein